MTNQQKTQHPLFLLLSTNKTNKHKQKTDADMVAKPNFFTKILEVMTDDDNALTLTPQG